MKNIDHAHNALVGLSVGDALGGFFEFSLGRNHHMIKTRTIPKTEWRYTDDTQMALSIYKQVHLYGEIRQDELAQSFAEHFDPKRGYGMGARHLLKRVKQGHDWRPLSKQLFRGEGSFGNGGAMRIAPLGAFFADDIESLIGNARQATEITHAHPEGVTGGVAVAVACAYAVLNRDAPPPPIDEFINRVVSHLPDSEVKENCLRASQIPSNTPIRDVGKLLGNGSGVSAMDTVPVALWCAVRWFDDFEEGFWNLASLGGDVDTTCAIMGGIIGSRSIDSIPQAWLDYREALPEWAIG